MRPDALPPDLLRKLNVAAPRYTSYPTVPSWSEAFGDTEWAAALGEAGRDADEPLSLYVHIPFCRELCTYCGCNVIVSRDPAKADRYLSVLAREVALVAGRLGHRRTLSRIHLGGGTPTFLDERQLERLWTAITAHFRVASGAEVAIEVDPVVTRRTQLELLGSFGFNRISMGVQDFDADVQRAVKRIQSVEETAAAIAHARAAGFRSVNLDLIYGLPHQTVESFSRTMDTVVALAPDRVAVFSFAYVPDARPNQRKLPVAHIPGGEAKLALLTAAQQRLDDAGYERIGFDHFARPGDELARARRERRLWRDFQGYTTRRAAATVAVGLTGISDLGVAYAQTGRSLVQYEAAIDGDRQFITRGLRLNDDDRRRRAIIIDLLCNEQADLGADAKDAFATELEALAGLAQDGLVQIENDRQLALTELGRTFARNVAMVFDVSLRQPAVRRTFSTTI
jgi:oxygen-independent coproporphyrinogen-3 oxidase